MIIAQLATIQGRQESVKETIKSLLPQVDALFVGLNNYSEIPNFCKHPKIESRLFDNSTGDAVKFFDVENREGYFFTCDDDLVYPEGYVRYLINRIEMYDRQAIVTLHGRSFYNTPIANYYSSATVKLRCLGDVERDQQVNVGGTGVMAFHTSTVKVKYSDFQAPNMADVWMAKLAHEQGVPIMVIEHKHDYLRYIHPVDNIYDKYKSNCTLQTKIINSFL